VFNVFVFLEDVHELDAAEVCPILACTGHSRRKEAKFWKLFPERDTTQLAIIDNKMWQYFQYILKMLFRLFEISHLLLDRSNCWALGAAATPSSAPWGQYLQT
jgi:hypothetical protein